MEAKVQILVGKEGYIKKYETNFAQLQKIIVLFATIIEHYFPKEKYPLLSYDWENLFYCCDKCQSEANKTLFQETLKPSDASYHFTKYFYFDLASGEIKVLENLETESPIEFVRASAFLVRYGICSNPKRNEARKRMYKIIRKVLLSDDMQRDDFEYRYVYDFCMERLGIK
jgi:hypothetical protein